MCCGILVSRTPFFVFSATVMGISSSFVGVTPNLAYTIVASLMSASENIGMSMLSRYSLSSSKSSSSWRMSSSCAPVGLV